MISATQTFLDNTKILDFMEARPDLEIRVCYFKGDVVIFPDEKKFFLTSMDNMDRLKKLFPEWERLLGFCRDQWNDDKDKEGLEDLHDKVLTVSFHDEEYKGEITRMMWTEYYDPANPLAWSLFNPPVYPKKAE